MAHLRYQSTAKVWAAGVGKSREKCCVCPISARKLTVLPRLIKKQSQRSSK